MKIIIRIVLICFLFSDARAQANSDSLAYQLQRKKINSMLAERSQKFGQYGESLTRHTGIFGLQTKNDLRRSNDILMDIVKTDNDIYQQLKILLDYRTFQQAQVRDSSKQVEQYNIGYMNTINRLRNDNDRLKKQIDENISHQEKVSRTFTFIVVLLLGIILFILRKRNAAKTSNL
jgi:hypothetical protein